MLELHHVHDAPTAPAFGASAGAPALTVGLARRWDEVEAAQRLRYEVFTQALGARLEGRPGLDEDRFDRHCEHLLVRCNERARIVGTYRILTPAQARVAGGYYSETEFDLSALEGLRAELVEFGRSCVHPDYRNGAVIMLLWTGLARFLRANGYRYVFGCASVSLCDGGHAAAGLARQAARMERAPLRVRPRRPWRGPDSHAVTASPRVPPLIKGYLKLGARICGEPAWDPHFNTADFPMLFDVTSMDPRYRRHFGLGAQRLE